MTLEPGVFCIFNAPGDQRIDERTGFPGVRVSVPPGPTDSKVDILSFGEEGWLGGRGQRGPSSHHRRSVGGRHHDLPAEGATESAPKIQIQQLSDGTVPVSGPVRTAPSQVDVANAEVAAHISGAATWWQRLANGWATRAASAGSRFLDRTARRDRPRGDRVSGGAWPWLAVALVRGWAVLRKPRDGASHPRPACALKGEAAQRHSLRVRATFTDGATAGPVDGSRTCEAESLAPLEAFMIEIVPIDAGRGASEPSRPRTAAPRGPARIPPAAKPPTPVQAGPSKAAPSKGEPSKAGARGKPGAPAGRRK